VNRSRRKGSGLIEFALGFSALVILLVGMVEIAVTMVMMNQLTAAVRSGARFASTVDFDDPGNRFVNQIRNVVVYGVPLPGEETQPAAPGLTPSNVVVTWERDAAGAPRSITVSLHAYRVPLFFGEHELDNRPRMTVQHSGAWSPARAALSH